jgi:hypothetical protein
LTAGAIYDIWLHKGERSWGNESSFQQSSCGFLPYKAKEEVIVLRPQVKIGRYSYLDQGNQQGRKKMLKGKKVSLVLMVCLAFVVAGLFPGALAYAEPPVPILDEIPPTWSRTLPADKRFKLVMEGAAVLDKETGLVWERSPDPTKTDDWYSVIDYCYQLEVGGRKGWHLPTIAQLASLVDTTQSNPSLPNNHPFINIQSTYWSTTQYAPVSAGIWVVDFDNGAMYGSEGEPNAAWCVRGGQTEFTW